MIGKIAGRVDYKALDHALIDVRGVGYMLLVKDMNHPVTVYANNVVPVALSLTLLGGVLACLVFMWQVRHPKSE